MDGESSNLYLVRDYGEIWRCYKSYSSPTKRRLIIHYNQPEAVEDQRPGQRRDKHGRYVTPHYKGPLPKKKATAKLTNREVFNHYMTLEFVEWLMLNEPKTFADIWAKLQPKDLNIEHRLPQHRQIYSFDRRVREILWAGVELSDQEKLAKIKALVGYDRPFTPDIDGAVPMLLGSEIEQIEENVK